MKYKEKTDEQLMQLVTQGDQDALAILYDRYAGSLVGVVKHIVGDQKVAEDVLQETFWRVWDKADSFDFNKGKFKTWVFSIGRRQAIDIYRRQKIRPEAAPNEHVLLRLEKQPDETDVMNTVAHNIAGEHIKEALSTLSDEQRAAIEMAYFQGKTRQEISTETNIPLGTIHTRVRLALKNLSRVLHHHREGGRS